LISRIFLSKFSTKNSLSRRLFFVKPDHYSQLLHKSTITNKEAALALETLHKYIEGNEGIVDLFKSLGILENRIENNILNKQKQLTLHQF